MAVAPGYVPKISFRDDGTIWLPLDCWKSIRGNFTTEERAKLNGAIVSQIICPETAILDSYHLGPELAERLRRYAKEK